MAEVTFSNAAETDLIDIDEFSSARFGDEVGEVYMFGFHLAFARLADFPMAGPELPDYGVGIRCLKRGSHRIFYRMNGDDVLILRILHHAREAKSSLIE